MKRPAPQYLLVSVLALGLVLVVGEGWILQRSRLAATRAFRALERKKQERDWLARQSPVPNPENEAAINADLAGAGRLLAGLRQALQGPDPALLDSPPARPIDAFFELAGFVEKLRVRAAQAQVALKPDERFGFATHTNEGPAADTMAAVHRQWRVTQYLVEKLLESHPLALLAVRRERPVTSGPRDQRERADDFFELDRPLSLRQPGEIAGEAFRLEFTGQTEVLRNFLNSLAAVQQPIVVRSVEVEPLAVPGASTSEAAAGSPVPLVRETFSKFVVTGEYISPQPVP